MFNHRYTPLLPRHIFVARLLRVGAIAAAIVFGALAIGTVGYHGIEGLPWIDSLLNASMLLSGMGPLYSPVTTSGKLFATFYALFSGVVFLTVAAVLFAPVAHRVIHRFHLELVDDQGPDKPPSHRTKTETNNDS